MHSPTNSIIQKYIHEKQSQLESQNDSYEQHPFPFQYTTSNQESKAQPKSIQYQSINIAKTIASVKIITKSKPTLKFTKGS